jgi:hypothetical protein
VNSVTEASIGVDDINYRYPLGLIDFVATCVNPGDTADITFYWHGLPSIGTYRKYGSSLPGAMDASYKDLITNRSSVLIDGALVGVTSYTITDGLAGDDSVITSEIIDPTGPAVASCSETLVTIAQPNGVAAGSPMSAAQSFVAQATGDLIEVGVGLINPSADVTVNIRSGDGTAGVILASQVVSTAAFPASGTATTYVLLTTPLAVTSGSTYTAEFTSASAFDILDFGSGANGPINPGRWYF